MKARLLTLLLACVMLFAVLSLPVSAESDTVDFKLELNAGKIYGAALKTPVSVIYAMLSRYQAKIYDGDSNLLPADSQVYFGTGFRVKLDKAVYTAVVMGDINGDGELTATDYVQIKRTCLGTFSVSNSAKEASGMERGGELRPIHYVMIKRAYFNTYEINRKYTCEPYNPFGGDGWSNIWI